MAFAETLKALGTVVVEAVKENPVAAASVAAVAVIGTGGTVWYRKRKAKAVKPLQEITITPEVAAVAAAAVAAANATATTQAESPAK